MGRKLYRRSVAALSVSIAMIVGAIALSVALMVFALHDSLSILSVFGLWDQDLEGGLGLAWPVAILTVGSVAWSEFVFIPAAKALFDSPDTEIAAFGINADRTQESLMDVRVSLNRYALFALPIALALLYYVRVAFANILFVAVLIAIQIGLLVFFRDKVKLLKADRSLLP